VKTFAKNPRQPNFRSLMKRKFFWRLAAEISIVFDAVFEEEVEPPGQNPL